MRCGPAGLRLHPPGAAGGGQARPRAVLPEVDTAFGGTGGSVLIMSNTTSTKKAAGEAARGISLFFCNLGLCIGTKGTDHLVYSLHVLCVVRKIELQN